MAFLGRMLGKILYRVEVEGLENFPADGPVLALVKHERNEDIPLGFAFVLQARRPDNWCVMKHDLAAPQYLGLVLKAGGIPIDRDRPMRSRRSFRLAREVLHDGRALVLFPEQTFFLSEMGPGRFPGFRYLTKHAPAEIQVVPVGLRYIPPTRFPGRTRAIVRIGPPQALAPEVTRRQSTLARFFYGCMREIARLSDLEYSHPAPEQAAR